MSIRTYVIASTIFSALTLATAPAAHAQIYGVITVREAPPPLRAEVVPAPRHGYVWAPGYWSWQGHHHVWHRGDWVRVAAGLRLCAAGLDRARWSLAFHDGRWARGDRDGDGGAQWRRPRPYDPTRR